MLNDSGAGNGVVWGSTPREYGAVVGSCNCAWPDYRGHCDRKHLRYCGYHNRPKSADGKFVLALFTIFKLS